MIKKDFNFVMKVLKHTGNKPIHLPALKNLIINFKNKWEDNLGKEIPNFYVKQLNKEYQNGL
jgi:hypothetical protein|tara:strand:- start:189 stop:374 length:186 start_codon:yes stop_codon:yes gene_type:complete